MSQVIVRQVPITSKFNVSIMSDTDSITLFIEDNQDNKYTYWTNFWGYRTFLNIPPPNYIEKLFNCTWQDKVAVGIRRLEKRISQLEQQVATGKGTTVPEPIRIANQLGTDISKK